jgi:hypothetical protein
MSERSAYIPDMSCQDSKRARHRQRQARYEARLRDGIGLFPTPICASKIDVLITPQSMALPPLFALGCRANRRTHRDNQRR